MRVSRIISFNKDASAIIRGLRIDFNSSRNLMIMLRGRSGGGLLTVISAYDDFAMGFGLGAPFPLLRGAGGPTDVGKR